MSRVRAPSPALWFEVQFRGRQCRTRNRTNAGRIARVAQLVEHTLGKGEVIGSIPIASSEGEVMVEAQREGTATTIGQLSNKSIEVCAVSDGRARGATKQGGRWGTIASGGYWLSNPFSFRESRYGEGKV